MINSICLSLINGKKYKRICFVSIVYILFCLSILFYLKSLRGCFGPFNYCASHKRLKLYFRLGFLLFISCVIFGASITLQIIARLHYINYLIFFIIYFIIFFSNQGTDFAHHGTYNSINLLNNLFSLIISILFFSYVFINFKTLFNCRNFYDGLGGYKLNNNKELNACYIKKPKICGHDLLSGLFDVNYFRKNGCEGYNDKKKLFLKYLNDNYEKFNNFSYPRTEYWNPKKSFHHLSNLVEKQIHPINDNNIENREVFVSFKENKGKIEIHLKKNKTLIKAKRILAKNNFVKFENIYLIYFDAVSRRNFIRKLKKSSQLIEKILYSNERKGMRTNQFNSFQFFKYHNFNGHTQGNIFPLFYGNEAHSNKGISIVKFFNEKGYITAAAHNSCNREIFDWNKFKKKIKLSHYDHENVAMFCDPNYEDKKHIWSVSRGKCSILRRCFYGRDSFDYNFEYILQFLEAYKKERKYFRITFGDGHEATTEVVKYIDNSLYLFIQKILKDYFDDKTAIIILSDHGAQIPGPFNVLFYDETIFEKYLGLLIFIIPNDNNDNLENLFYNQQQLITTYDIHDTLLDMINISKNEFKNMNIEKGQSLFQKVNGKERNCQKYKGEITSDYCFCENYI